MPQYLLVYSVHCTVNKRETRNRSMLIMEIITV
jgi:hypothetical protein